MARSINANIYGPSEDWINPFTEYGDTDGSWGQASWHNTHWIYDPANNTGQEYNYPPESSIALWGIRNDFSASTKAVTHLKLRREENDVIYAESSDTAITETTETSSPVIAYMARGYGSDADEPATQWISPIAQWGYDVKADDEELRPSTRLPDNPHVGATTIFGTSIPITHLNRKNFVMLPKVHLAMRNQVTGETFIDDNVYTLDEAYVMMSIAGGGNEIFPVGISFMPYIGQEVPDEDHPRVVLTQNWIEARRFRMLTDTLNDLTLTEGLKDFYSSHDIPDISATRRVVDSDSPLTYSQAPFTAYNKLGNHRVPTLQGVVDWLDMIPPIGGVTKQVIQDNYTSGMIGGVFQINQHLNTANQKFEDVNYHWSRPTWFYQYDPVNNFYLPLSPTVDINGVRVACLPALQIDDAKGRTKADAYIRALLHECASTGWWFALSEEDALSEPTGKHESNLYLPLMEYGGITNGLYVTGADLINEDQADIGDTRDIDYTPTPYPDTTPDGRSGDWSYQLRNFDLNTKKYHVMTSTEYALVRYILQGTHTVHDPVSGEDKEVANLADYGGVNAGDWITCLYWYPFNIPTRTNSEEQVMAGPLYLGANAPLWNEATLSNTYDLGTYYVGDNTLAYHDFRGYNYSKIYLRLPFYGDFELDLHRYYGGEINVKAIIDFSSAHGTYMIFSNYEQNWLLFDTVDFKCGVQLPMDSTGMGTYQNQMHVAEKQMLNAKLALAGSVATGLVGAGLGVAIGTGSAAASALSTAQKLGTGGAVGTVGALSRMADAKYTLEHTTPTPGKCLPASPFCAAIQDLDVRIIFLYPKCADGYGKEENGYNLSKYGHNTGFACIQQGRLDTLGLHGLTVISNARFSEATGTASETAMLLEALSEGIIL